MNDAEATRLEELAHDRGFVVVFLGTSIEEANEESPVAMYDLAARATHLREGDVISLGEAEAYIRERSG